MTKAKIFVCAFLTLLLVSIHAFANNVENISINVVVDDNGDAEIIQRWTGFFDSGTENYIVVENLDGMDIENFSVHDDNSDYTYVKNWDINDSRNQKANKCGVIKTSEGYELCWGIGEYGNRTYYVSYTVTGFVKAYNDYDGSHFMYVNPGMSTFPTDVSFALTLENGIKLTQSNTRVWAFGFDGYCDIDNGALVAYTHSSLEDEMSFIVTFSLDKGIISPSKKENSDFEDVVDKAMKGSDYSDYTFEDKMFLFVFGSIFATGITAAVGGVVYTVKLKRERKKFAEAVEYFRERPNSGRLEVSFYLAKKFTVGTTEGDVIGAMIMQMMNDGSISCQTEKSVGFFGKEKQTHEIQLLERPTQKHLATLYDIMKAASGEDGVLQEKELEKYSSNNYTVLRSFIDGVNDDGENVFCAIPGYVTGISSRLKGLTDAGKNELSEIIGLKKYLEDFTLIAEREVKEIDIWQEYLVYATLFGIADKVIEQLKNVYPESIPQIEEYTRRVNMTGVYYRSMYRSMYNAEQRARSAGRGGHASFGGGGGFSGGGRGGGSR